MKAANTNPAHMTRPVDSAIVRRMIAQVSGQTDETLTRQFGISYNTWRKIRSGAAIRLSVADRLERRVRAHIEVAVTRDQYASS